MEKEINPSVKIKVNAEQSRSIKKLREELDKITRNLIELIARRKKLVLELDKLKKKNNLPVFDKVREKEAISLAKKTAQEKEINPNLVKKIIKLLMDDAKRIQKKK